MARVGALLLLLLCGGCTLERVERYMDARAGQSCVYSFGFLGPFFAVRTVTATGGMSVTECTHVAP